MTELDNTIQEWLNTFNRPSRDQFFVILGISKDVNSDSYHGIGI